MTDNGHHTPINAIEKMDELMADGRKLKVLEKSWTNGRRIAENLCVLGETD